MQIKYGYTRNYENQWTRYISPMSYNTETKKEQSYGQHNRNGNAYYKPTTRTGTNNLTNQKHWPINAEGGKKGKQQSQNATRPYCM